MSREVAGDVPLGAAAAAGNRSVSEPAFELLFSEIIAYTGAYVSHSATSHTTDMLRAAEAGVVEEEGVEKDGEGEDGDSDGNGALVEPSPASVGAGNQLLPVRVRLQQFRVLPHNTRCTAHGGGGVVSTTALRCVFAVAITPRHSFVYVSTRANDVHTRKRQICWCTLPENTLLACDAEERRRVERLRVVYGFHDSPAAQQHV